MAIAATIALTLGACSNGDTEDPDASQTAELSSERQAALDAAYAGVGGDLSTLASVEVSKDESFYVISCGEQVPSCHLPAAAMVEAAETAGWTAAIADGNLNAGGTGFGEAINQAVAAGASVIVPIGFPCVAAQTAFAAAADAGVVIVGGGGVDNCDPPEWDSIRYWMEGFDDEKGIWEQQAKLQADYAYGKIGDDLKAVVLNATGGPWGQYLVDGFSAELEALGLDPDEAVVETIDVSDQENGDGSYIQKVQTALLNHPEANALIVPVDGWLTNGLSQAIVSSDLDEQYLVIGRSGDEAALELIRAGDSGLDATVGYASEWGAWGSIDTAIRVRAGEDPAYIGESIQLIDADNNLPDSGDYTGAVDFRAAFTAAWGVN
ncbi:MAG: substrate-binding domain-containing protein [Microbacterium sp.]|uniref:sugar ABC transporter substrate-binding protein n=1 Tax=Microbacterium sp. TaxID=51671 RepID=UPI0039E38C9B